MVKRARETEKSPQTPCNDANCQVTEHSVAHLLHWDREGQLWGDWGAADSSVVKSAKRGRDNDLI